MWTMSKTTKVVDAMDILFFPWVMKASMLSFYSMGMYMLVWKSSNIAHCTQLSLSFFIECKCQAFKTCIINNETWRFPFRGFPWKFCFQKPFHQINACLVACNDPCNQHSSGMCIKHHQCEQVKFHIIGAKGGIHWDCPIIT